MSLEELTCDGVVPDHYNKNDIKMDKTMLLDNSSDRDDGDGSPTESNAQHPFQKTCLGVFLNPISTRLINLLMGFDPFTDENNIKHRFGAEPKIDLNRK